MEDRRRFMCLFDSMEGWGQVFGGWMGCLIPVSMKSRAGGGLL